MDDDGAARGAAAPDGALPRLLARVEDVRNQLAGFDLQIALIVAASADSNADDEHDPEGATIAFERAQLLALRNDARATLTALDLAVQRARRGHYGECERCGRAISGERLLARPATQLCITCAGRRDPGRGQLR